MSQNCVRRHFDNFRFHFNELIKKSKNYCGNERQKDNVFERPFPRHFNTLTIHAGQEPELWNSLCVTPALITSCVFRQGNPGENSKGKNSSNPSKEVLQDCLCALYNSRYCVCFSSGMAAKAACFFLVKPGEHIICGKDLYGDTLELLSRLSRNYKFSLTFVDSTSTDSIERKIRKETRLIYVESPSFPCMKIADLEKLAKIAKNNNVYFVVDNSAASVYLQNPLEFGTTMVLDSLTTLSNGHYDVLGGSINTNIEKVGQKLKTLQSVMGTSLSPFDSYLITRGLKTLCFRLKRQMANTREIANFLQRHPKVSKVIYPGLPSHPQHQIAKKQMSGFGGLLTFYLKGTVDNCRRFAQKLKYFKLSISFGGCNSLIAIPAQMTHENLDKKLKETNGINRTMLTIAVGIENVEDLIEDLNEALEKYIK